MSKVQLIPLASINRHAGTQCRERMSQDHIDDIREAIRNGEEIEPVILYHDGSEYYAGDGFHRMDACEAENLEHVPAYVRKGTLRDAKLYAASANAEHKALKRSNADKVNQVNLLLEDSICYRWSDRQIATHVGVSPTTVGNCRRAFDERRRRHEEQSPPSGHPSYEPDDPDTGPPETPRCPDGHPSDEPETPTDRFGQALFDDGVASTLAGATEIKALAREAHDLAVRVEAVKGKRHGSFISQSVIAELEAAKNALNKSAPHCQCPMCRGSGSGCAACHGAGVLDIQRWQQVPQEIRDAVTGGTP